MPSSFLILADTSTSPRQNSAVIKRVYLVWHGRDHHVLSHIHVPLSLSKSSLYWSIQHDCMISTKHNVARYWR